MDNARSKQLCDLKPVIFEMADHAITYHIIKQEFYFHGLVFHPVASLLHLKGHFGQGPRHATASTNSKENSIIAYISGT